MSAVVSPPVAAHPTAARLVEAIRRAYAAADRFLVTRPLLDLIVSIGYLFFGMIGLERWLRDLGRLPAASYGREIFITDVLRRLVSTDPGGLLALTVLGAAVVAAVRTRSLGPGWQDIHRGGRLRILIGIVAFLLAWSFATYDYNYFFDQPHTLERFLVLGALPLVILHPVAVPLFLAVVIPVVWQFTIPIGAFSWTSPILLLRVLFLFAAFWSLRLFHARARTADFVFLLFCVIAGHYWVSGYGKLTLGWLGADQIGLLLPATYANGWLGFLSPDAISKATLVLLDLNVPLKLGTLLVECGALFALWRATTVRLFLSGAILMHLGIVAVSGIFFWSWMILDAAVLSLFFGSRGLNAAVFSRRHFVLSVLIIASGIHWFGSARLAWLDARATYTYRVEGLGRSGRTYRLPPAEFAPYDTQFTAGGFRYLVTEPRLRITWGSMRAGANADALGRATEPEHVFALERQEQGWYDAERAAAFDNFVQTFVIHRNARAADRHWWQPLQPPPLLITFPRTAPPANDPIVRVTVVEVTSLFDGQRYREIRKVPVRIIDVPVAAPAARARGR